jgi:beta-lactam-binding protein with PASTA domain
MVEVPRVVDLRLDEAEGMIEDAGLSPHPQIGDSDVCDTADPMTVFDQTPEEGEEVPIGTGVTLYFCGIPAVFPVSVPPVVGMSVAEAQATLTDADLGSTLVTGVESPEPCDPGEVWQQIPAAGHVVAAGFEVRLYVCE